MMEAASAPEPSSSNALASSSSYSQVAVEAIAKFSTFAGQFALKEAVHGMESKLRDLGDNSSDAVFSAWHLAEHQMGLEVHIPDPAIRNLFGLHVVAVEDLCFRVRAQAQATLDAAGIWNDPQLAVVSRDWSMDSGEGDAQVLKAKLSDADKRTSAMYERLSSRIESEVFSVIARRFEEHERIRELVRTRQRWSLKAAAAGRNLTRQKQDAKSQETPDSDALAVASAPKQACGRLQDATRWIAKLDEKVMIALDEMMGQSEDAVRKPWAALVHIQAEFFAAQQALWTPLVQPFEDFASVGGRT